MRGLLAVLLFAVSFSVVAESEKPAINKAKTEQQKPDANSTQNQSGPVVTINFPSANGETKGDKKKEEEHASISPEAETAYWTKVLAIFTAALVVVTALVWLATNNIFKDTKQSSKRNLRAYVCLTTFRAKAIADADGKILYWSISPGIINAGNTPARNTMNRSNFIFSLNVMPKDFDFKDQESPEDLIEYEQGTQSMLGPKIDITLGHFNIPIQECVELFSREKHAYLYGWIEYDDVFENTDRHRTEFCCEVFVRSDPNLVDPNPFGFAPFRMYNGADDDCKYPTPKRPPSPWHVRYNPFS